MHVAASGTLGSERALGGKFGTTPVREGMAHEAGLAPVSGKILNRLAVRTAVMANGRCRNGRPPSIAAPPHGRNEPDAVGGNFLGARLQNSLSPQLHRNPRFHAAARADAQASCSEIEDGGDRVADEANFRCGCAKVRIDT